MADALAWQCPEPSMPPNRLPENGELLGDNGTGQTAIAEFYKHPLSGKDYIKINIPGNAYSAIDVPADDFYRREYPRAWKVYTGEIKPAADALTPLRDSGICPEVLLPHLAALNIHTVEGLAAVTDGNVDSATFHGLVDMRDKAREFVAAKRTRQANALTENTELRREVDELRSQVSQLLSERQQTPGRAAKR